MNKNELLEELLSKIKAGEISREEVTEHLQIKSVVHESANKKTSHFSVTGMLYVFGAAVTIIGLIIFISQIWDDIGSVAHILLTLGLGLSLAAFGSVLLKQKPEDNIGSIFHLLGGVLIPGGALVTLDEIGSDIDSIWPVAVTFGIIFAFYLALTRVHKNAVVTFFAIVNGTAFVYLLVGAIDDFRSEDLYIYLTMTIGASYLLLAHSFQETWNERLLSALYFFGTAGILGAGFAKVLDSSLWELFYFLIVFAGLYLSVNLSSRIILVVSTLFLIIHVSYITGEYFADSLGWPLALILLGFIIIGLGYGSVQINKKYIKEE